MFYGVDAHPTDAETEPDVHPASSRPEVTRRCTLAHACGAERFAKAEALTSRACFYGGGGEDSI